MLIFWDQRLALLATPKTGTTAIAAALESLADVSIQRPPELKHTPARRFRRFLAPFLEQVANEPFTLVGVMREPRDWLSSWYRYRQRDGMVNKRNSTKGITFDDFVQAYCADKPPAFAAVGSQATFLRPPNTEGADLLFRHDKIADLVCFLEDRLNFEIVLPKLNVSPLRPTALSPETEALLHRFAARDFDLYAGLCRSDP